MGPCNAKNGHQSNRSSFKEKKTVCLNAKYSIILFTTIL